MRITRIVVMPMVAAVLAMSVLPSTPVANAKTPNDPGATHVGWTQLGRADQIELRGADEPANVALPISPGQELKSVTGQLGSLVNITEGAVEVLDSRGVVLDTIPIPRDGRSAPFTVDTSAAEPVDGDVDLRFALRGKVSSTTTCDPPQSVMLSELTSVYSGTASTPTTVADFLPGYLDGIEIRVGQDPTPDQQQAALSLVAMLTHKYRPIPVRINVTGAQTKAAVPGARRVIEIRTGPKPGVTLENGGTADALLVISGEGPALARQVEAFVDGRVALAQTDSATVLAADTELPGTTDTLTFGQLDVAGEVSVLGTTTLYAGFDTGMFGVGSIQGAQIHLLADHTVVEDGEASVLIRSGPTVLASRALDSTGNLDLFLDIPPEAITTNVGLALELRYIPNQECPPLGDRMTFALDPASTVSVTPGTRNRGGFPVLPMSFSPDFDVALSQPGFVRYAAQAINLMAQQTAVPMRPQVVPLNTAADSSTPLLAVTTGDDLRRLGWNAPLQPGENEAVAVNGPPTAEIDLNSQLGVVQTFSHNDRVILDVDVAGDGRSTERSFDYIRGLENRWATLTGDVVATGPAGETANLTVRSGGFLAPVPDPGSGWRTWIWVSIGTVCVAALFAALFAAWQWRRTHRRDG